MQTKLTTRLFLTIILLCISNSACFYMFSLRGGAYPLYTIEDCETYLKTFPDGPGAETATYRIAWHRDTIEALEEYLQHYPEGGYSNEDQKRIEYLEHLVADSMHTIQGYKNYISKYPQSKYLEDAQENLAFLQALETDQIEAYREYLVNYWEYHETLWQLNKIPRGIHEIEVRQRMADLEFDIIKDTNSLEAYNRYKDWYYYDSSEERQTYIGEIISQLMEKRRSSILSKFTFKTLGLTETYSKVFEEKKHVVADYLVEARLDSSIYPTGVYIVYDAKGGEISFDCPFTDRNKDKYRFNIKKTNTGNTFISLSVLRKLMWVLNTYRNKVVESLDYQVGAEVKNFLLAVYLIKPNGDDFVLFGSENLFQRGWGWGFEWVIQFHSILILHEGDQGRRITTSDYYYLNEPTADYLGGAFVLGPAYDLGGGRTEYFGVYEFFGITTP